MSLMRESFSVAGRKWVSSHYRGNDFFSEERIEVKVFEVQPAVVKASYGLTVNLGNYETARCSAGVELPTYVEEIPEAFEKAWALAEQELQKQISKISEGT